MLADIRDGQIAAVVAWDLDRLHRRPIELEGFMALADERHLALATVSGDVDLSTAQGRLVARLKGSVAAHDIDQMKHRMRRAAVQRAEQGVPQWKRAFGYADGYVADEITAPLVKEMYATVLAGGSLSGLARDLNARGEYAWGQKWVKPKDEHGNTIKSAEVVCQRQRWSASTLSLFLRSPRNAGLRSHNREIVTGKEGQPVRGAWPALVDESTWRAVQSVLNAPGRAPGRKTVSKHVLTGVLRCGRPGCGGYMSGSWVMLHLTGRKPGRRRADEPLGPLTGQSGHRIAYACKTCRGCSVRAEHAEPAVRGMVASRLARPDAVDLLKAGHDEVETEGLRTERNALLAQIADAEAEYDEGIIDGRRLAGRIERVRVKLADVEHRQQDDELRRVFVGMPLGTPEVEQLVMELSPDRLRAVLDVLATITVLPVGKGHRPKGGERFDPDRLVIDWK